MNILSYYRSKTMLYVTDESNFCEEMFQWEQTKTYYSTSNTLGWLYFQVSKVFSSVPSVGKLVVMLWINHFLFLFTFFLVHCGLPIGMQSFWCFWILYSNWKLLQNNGHFTKILPKWLGLGNEKRYTYRYDFSMWVWCFFFFCFNPSNALATFVQSTRTQRCLKNV